MEVSSKRSYCSSIHIYKFAPHMLHLTLCQSTLTKSGVRIGLRASVLNVRTAEAGGQHSLMPSPLTKCNEFPKRVTSSAEALRHLGICSGDNSYTYGRLLLLYKRVSSQSPLYKGLFLLHIFSLEGRDRMAYDNNLIKGERPRLYSHLAGVRILLLLK
jgi:hypothetical protein